MGIIRRVVKHILNIIRGNDTITETLEDGSELRLDDDQVDIEVSNDSAEYTRSFRRSSYRNMSESKIADRAVENHNVFSDVLSDPDLVDAEGEVEAVAKVAAENPGWASFVDFQSDLGVDPGEVDAAVDGDVHAGESQHGTTGDAAPDYSPSGVSSSGDSGGGETAGVETGVSIDTDSGSVDTGGGVDGGGGSV